MLEKSLKLFQIATSCLERFGIKLLLSSLLWNSLFQTHKLFGFMRVTPDMVGIAIICKSCSLYIFYQQRLSWWLLFMCVCVTDCSNKLFSKKKISCPLVVVCLQLTLCKYWTIHYFCQCFIQYSFEEEKEIKILKLFMLQQKKI